MKINTLEGICNACGKEIVGIEIAGKEHWHHKDGKLYRHIIIPRDEKYYQRSDFEEMRDDRDKWIGECTRLQGEINRLKKENSDLGWAVNPERMGR